MRRRFAIGDRAESLDGVVNHRESATYLWFREPDAGGGMRYVIRIKDMLSHEPSAVWETVSPNQSATSRISVLSMRPDYAFDPVTNLVGR